MDTRSVQETGGSTYVVSLPKKWAKQNGIVKGTEVGVFPDDSSLVIENLQTETKSKGEMDITGMDEEHVKRSIITMYVAGFDLIEIKSDRITAEQRRALREANHKLSGLEVIEETGDMVVFQDLLDFSELSIHKTVSRMSLIAENMFKDSIKAVLEQQKELSNNVIERDDDVDKMFATVSRVFRSSLGSYRYKEELGLTREECFDFHTTARQLERIADHSTKIAKVSSEIKEEVPENVANPIEEMSDEAIGIVEKATESMLELEGNKAIKYANDALDSVEKMDDFSRNIDEKIHNLDSQTSQNLGLIIDSIRRTADYGANISETSLQSSAPRSK